MKLGLRGKMVLVIGATLLVLLLAAAALARVFGVGSGITPYQLGLGLAALAAVLIALVFGMTRLVVRPLERITVAIELLRRGEPDFTVRLGRRGHDELARLNDGINALLLAVARRERELVAAKEAVQADGHAMTRSLAVMSHELRTPLNAVLGMAELLAGSRLDARQQRFVEQIRASGRTLVDITNDLLDLSRLEAGRLDVVSKPFRLHQAVAETVDMHRERAESRALALVMHIDESLPETVSGDAVHLRQILGNLLSNAIKFTERGSVILRVTPSAGFVRFSVSDTGAGIAPDFMPHIYEAFRQADNSPTRRFGGAGLGLAIARHLCIAMGGRIDASSRHGRGSTFWFELPMPAVLGGATADPEAVDYTARPRGFAANDSPGAQPSTDVDVLLIEDSVSNQALVRESLANSAYRLTVVADGTAAVRQVHARHFDIVLLDWQLPGVNGLAVLAALRDAEARQGRPRAHVIAVTAHTGPGDRETCLAAGADDYLGKPYTPADLLARMAMAKVSSAPLRH